MRPACFEMTPDRNIFLLDSMRPCSHVTRSCRMLEIATRLLSRHRTSANARSVHSSMPRSRAQAASRKHRNGNRRAGNGCSRHAAQHPQREVHSQLTFGMHGRSKSTVFCSSVIVIYYRLGQLRLLYGHARTAVFYATRHSCIE